MALAAIGRSAPALAVSASGLQAAQARAASDASTIAANGPDVSSMVDLDVQKDTYRALAVVIRASDEMTATAVDLLA
jgi:flagellar basal body rod protein FlgC